jgi:hypothetical protein
VATTTHRGIFYPGTPSTEAPKICEEFEKLANFFDNDAETKEGTVAERTAWETSGKKQVRGRLFFVSTAGSEHGLWWDNGTTWIQVNAQNAGQVSTTALANLGVTTSKIAEEGVTAAKIAVGAITDAKVASGRALVETGNSWTAKTAALSGTPSATRSASVMVTVFGLAHTAMFFNVRVGGVIIGRYELDQAATESGSFTVNFSIPIVPPGQKWELTESFGIVTAEESHILI